MSFTSTVFTLPLRAGFETASVHEMAVADFNGDGKLDVLLSYFLYPLENRVTPVRLLLGDGHGGFADGTAAVFGADPPSTVHGREIAVADFNGDGRADAFIADHGFDMWPFPGAQNQLILSAAMAGLANATATLPQLSDYTHSAEAADIDHDGDVDIYVGNGGGGMGGYYKPFVLLNDGHGAFTRTDAGLPAPVLGQNHWSEAFLDVDGDGDLDLFLGSSHENGSLLLLNDGHGAFAISPVAMPAAPAGEDAVDIQSADLNGDGRPDLIVDYSETRVVQTLINNGAGGFDDETAQRLPASVEGGVWARRVLLGDVNGDGKFDLLLSNNSDTPLYLNDGTGHFIQAPAGSLPGNLYDQRALGDLDGDGRLDMFVARGHFDGVEQFRVDLAAHATLAAPVITAFLAVMRSDPDASSNTALVTSLAPLSPTAALAMIVASAMNTSSVATLAYAFFVGRTPSTAGMDYLVSPTGPNPNNLNSAYYQSFNIENRYINFAVNLGKNGEGAVAFTQAYGALSFYDAFKQAYGVIFGASPSDQHIHDILDPVLTLNGQSLTRQQYFAAYGGDGLNGIGTKAAAVGWLMSEAEKADLGSYAKSNDAFLTDVANGVAGYGVDLIGQYAKPEYAYHA